GRAPVDLVSLVRRIEDAHRLPGELARPVAEDLLVAAIASDDAALAQQREADDAAVEDQLLLGERAPQLVRGHRGRACRCRHGFDVGAYGPIPPWPPSVAAGGLRPARLLPIFAAERMMKFMLRVPVLAPLMLAT